MSTAPPAVNDYAGVSAYELLRSAARGLIGIVQRLIHALVDNPATSVPDMLKFAFEDHAEDAVDLEPDIVAALRYLKTPDALPFFLHCMERDGEDLEDDVLQGIMALGAPALEPLLKLYSEMDEADSGDVAFALAGLAVRDERILPILLERLEYEPAMGSLAVGTYGDPAGLPALEKMLASISEEDDVLRREIQECINDIQNGASREAFFPEFDLFDRYPREAGPDFDVLSDADRVTLLASDSAAIRAEAARSFFQEEYVDATRARLLELARTDPDERVRGAAWQSLSGDDDREIRQALRAVALDASRPAVERGGALIALADVAGEQKEIHAAIEALYNEAGGR